MRKTGLGEDEATCCVQGSLLALEWTVAGSVGGVGACDYGSAVLSLGTFFMEGWKEYACGACSFWIYCRDRLLCERGRSLSTLHVSLSVPVSLAAASLRSLSFSHERDAMSKPQRRASGQAVPFRRYSGEEGTCVSGGDCLWRHESWCFRGLRPRLSGTVHPCPAGVQAGEGAWW